MAKSNRWKTEPAAPQLLLDSGLLFEVNRTFFHPIGLSLAMSGNSLFLQDERNKPGGATFSAEVIEKGVSKLRTFMTEFGNGKLDERRKVLGWSVQPISQAPKKGSNG